MPIQQFLILDAAKTASSKTFNTARARIDPRPVDTAAPGTVKDQNGTTIDLVGKSLAPVAVQTNPLYPANMKTALSGQSWAAIDSDLVFLPDLKGA